MLMRDGQPVYYAFANGHDKPPIEGSLSAVELALGLRPPTAPGAKPEKPWVVVERAGTDRESVVWEYRWKSGADALMKEKAMACDEWQIMKRLSDGSLTSDFEPNER
jgi:hypothetical protein